MIKHHFRAWYGSSHILDKSNNSGIILPLLFVLFKQTVIDHSSSFIIRVQIQVNTSDDVKQTFSMSRHLNILTYGLVQCSNFNKGPVT
jgi:hypothetical protein